MRAVALTVVHCVVTTLLIILRLAWGFTTKLVQIAFVVPTLILFMVSLLPLPGARRLNGFAGDLPLHMMAFRLSATSKLDAMLWKVSIYFARRTSRDQLMARLCDLSVEIESEREKHRVEERTAAQLRRQARGKADLPLKERLPLARAGLNAVSSSVYVDDLNAAFDSGVALLARRDGTSEKAARREIKVFVRTAKTAMLAEQILARSDLLRDS